MKREWRKSVVRYGKPKLAESNPGDYNFHSVYCFPPETVNKIETQGHMKNLDGCSVYSDTLYIDIDKPGHVAKATAILEDLKAPVKILSTGNRGIHAEVATSPLLGPNTIYSQKRWLKSAGLWELVDTSIYRPAGQFRALGAIHQKTGRRKTIVREIAGTPLVIPMLTPPPIASGVQDWAQEEGSPEAEFQLHLNLLAVRGVGCRTPHMYIVFKSAQRAGLTRQEAEECVYWWNDSQQDPHPTEYVAKKLRGFR